MDKIHIVRSARRRTVGIQILPDLSIKISIPYFFPKGKVHSFLKEKEAWIRQAQQQLALHTIKHDTNEYLYLGKRYQLVLRQNQKHIVELEDKLYIASTSQKYIKTYLESWYKQQARKLITKRVKHYAHLAGLHYNSVSLMQATTRWGSCSSQKNLSFNWKLIMAPLEVLDYVICHELAHLTELNHSYDFWEKVRKMFPIYRQYRTWLKRHGHTLVL